MADIRQTPVSNYPAYYGAGLLNYINEAASKPFGYENDPVRALTNLLGIPSAVKTLENTAYGMPNVLGTGMATQLRPEAKETVGNLLPMAPAAARLAAKGAAATGRYLAPELGNMAEQYAARTGLLQSVKPIDPAKQTAEGLLEYRKSQTAPNTNINDNSFNLYHGTDKDFSEFDKDLSNMVDGIWLTESKPYAEWMADKKSKLTNSDVAKVLNVKSSAKNPMIFDVLEEGKKIASEINEAIPKNALEAQELLSGGYGWNSVVKDLVNEAKSKKHDSLIIKNFNDAYSLNPDEVTTAHVIFNPQLLKIMK